MDQVTTLVNAAKVILLDRRNREYLKKNDPKAFEQLMAAVQPFDPDICTQVGRAEQHEQERLAESNCPRCADPRNETVDPECPHHGTRFAHFRAMRRQL